jgi:hypothetical protein
MISKAPRTFSFPPDTVAQSHSKNASISISESFRFCHYQSGIFQKARFYAGLSS